MKVRELMSPDPACCTPDAKLQDVARLMVEHDCGEIPIVETRGSKKAIGVITDRDITVRTVAEGRNPLEVSARECMTTPVVSVGPDADLDECTRVMEEKQLRRVLVVDDKGELCGIVAQADIARHAPKRETGDMVREVSKKDEVARNQMRPIS